MRQVGDPEFVGFCALRGADCAAKVVPKRHAHEKVGVCALRGGRPAVVEYSEISKEMAERTNSDGALAFSASHICVNYFSAAFLKTCAEELVPKMPLHVARKKIPRRAARFLILGARASRPTFTLQVRGPGVG